MIFQHFLLNANEANLYLIGCEHTLEGALIDAGNFDQRVADFVLQHGLKMKAVFITHGHWDHKGGVEDYQATFNCPVHDFSDLRDGQTVRIGRLSLRVMQTTGHTEDSISLLVEDEGVLFTGDALFAGSIGGTDSPMRKAELVENIRRKILTLPKETLIYSGHGPATTVGIEKEFNPFLQS